MKSIYFCACTPDGGVYHYREENEVLSFSEKYSLPNPMYMAVADSRAYVLLRETEAKTHFGGLISFDCGADGRLGNPSEIQSTGGIEPCHLSVRENEVYAVN